MKETKEVKYVSNMEEYIKAATNYKTDESTPFVSMFFSEEYLRPVFDDIMGKINYAVEYENNDAAGIDIMNALTTYTTDGELVFLVEELNGWYAVWLSMLDLQKKLQISEKQAESVDVRAALFDECLKKVADDKYELNHEEIKKAINNQ